MAQRIVYTRPDGGVSVVYPAPEYVARFATEAEALEAIQAKGVPTNAMNVHICDEFVIPASRRFRNCWRQVGGATPPSVSISLARAQRMSEIRSERDKRLILSDAQMARAQDIGAPAEIAALKTYRQSLRDLPQTINLNSIQDVDNLAAYEPNWPVEPV